MIYKNIYRLCFSFVLFFLIIDASTAETTQKANGTGVNHKNPDFSLTVPGKLKELSASMRPKNSLYLFAKPTKSFNSPSLTVNIKKPRVKKEKKDKTDAKKKDQNFGHQNPAPGRSIRTIKLKDQVLAVEENDIIVNNVAIVRYTLTIPLQTQPVQIVASGPKSDKTHIFDILKDIIASFESPDLMPDLLKTEDR